MRVIAMRVVVMGMAMPVRMMVIVPMNMRLSMLVHVQMLTGRI